MMIKSTSTTSTIGVTLMPTIPPRPERPPVTPAIGLFRRPSELHRAGAAALIARISRVIEGIARAVSFGFVRRSNALRAVGRAHVGSEQLGQGQALRLDLANSLLDGVVGNDCRQRHEQTDARGDQGFGNT